MSRNRVFGNDRTTSIRHLEVALGVFVVVFGTHLLMRFSGSFPIPFGPASAVSFVGIGLLASILGAYRNDGLVVSLALSISPVLSLVTAVEFLELTSPRAPYWMLAGVAIAIGTVVGVFGYLLGVVAARTQ